MPFKTAEKRRTYQNLRYREMIEDGLCNQCRADTEINPMTGKHFALCKEHREAANINRTNSRCLKKLRKSMHLNPVQHRRKESSPTT